MESKTRTVPRAAAVALVVLAAAAGCRRTPTYLDFKDAGSEFSTVIPQGWVQDGDKDLSRKPMAVVSFIGQVVAEDEGTPIGAILSVTKIYRERSDFPGTGPQYDQFKKAVLSGADALFGDDKGVPESIKSQLPKDVLDIDLAGLPAKSYRRDFTHSNPAHMQESYPMRLEDIVVRTPRAYYVLEYRATRDLFDRHRHAFERAKAAFKLAAK